MSRFPETISPARSVGIKADSKTGKRLFSFSFRYWRQFDYFGLDNEISTQSKWFVSLLEKLHELSKYEIDRFFDDRAMQKNWRYHAIKWDAINVPLQKAECDWIEADYLENETEFQFMQFQISRALGRIIGFWINHIFHIVFLDPMHNIQPTLKYNYATFKTKKLDCEYTSLLCEVDSLRRELICENRPCEARKLFSELAQPRPNDEAILVPISPEDWERINAILNLNSTASINDIMKSGIEAYTASHTLPTPYEAEDSLRSTTDEG